MVIHTDSFANERRFVCILKCRRTRVVSWWSRVLDGRVSPSHPPKKGRRQNKFVLPCFGLKYLAAPIPALQNLSSPPSPSAPRLLKSLIRRQPKQSSNRPSSRLFPHLCAGRRRRRRWSRFTTAPELPHLCPRPPHWVVHRQRRLLQPTRLIDTDFHRIRCASPMSSPSSPGLLHRAHRRTSALRCHSRSASVRGQPMPAHHPQRL